MLGQSARRWQGLRPDCGAPTGRALERELVHIGPQSGGDRRQLSGAQGGRVCRCQRMPGGGFTWLGEDEALVLTEGWNGSSWSGETSPSPLYGFQALTGVACPTAGDCWAVGEGLNHSGSGSRMNHRASLAILLSSKGAVDQYRSASVAHSRALRSPPRTRQGNRLLRVRNSGSPAGLP